MLRRGDGHLQLFEDVRARGGDWRVGVDGAEIVASNEWREPSTVLAIVGGCLLAFPGGLVWVEWFEATREGRLPSFGWIAAGVFSVVLMVLVLRPRLNGWRVRVRSGDLELTRLWSGFPVKKVVLRPVAFKIRGVTRSFLEARKRRRQRISYYNVDKDAWSLVALTPQGDREIAWSFEEDEIRKVADSLALGCAVSVHQDGHPQVMAGDQKGEGESSSGPARDSVFSDLDPLPRALYQRNIVKVAPDEVAFTLRRQLTPAASTAVLSSLVVAFGVFLFEPTLAILIFLGGIFGSVFLFPSLDDATIVRANEVVLQQKGVKVRSIPWSTVSELRHHFGEITATVDGERVVILPNLRLGSMNWTLEVFRRASGLEL
jgi:hypothetical protein